MKAQLKCNSFLANHNTLKAYSIGLSLHQCWSVRHTSGMGKNFCPPLYNKDLWRTPGKFLELKMHTGVLARFRYNMRPFVALGRRLDFQSELEAWIHY